MSKMLTIGNETSFFYYMYLDWKEKSTHYSSKNLSLKFAVPKIGYFTCIKYFNRPLVPFPPLHQRLL